MTDKGKSTMADPTKSGKVAKTAIAAPGTKMTGQVKFANDTIEKKRPVATPSSTNLTKVAVPPPPAGFVIKDEVEMLRAGYKNTHGDQVKTSGGAQAKDGNLAVEL